MKACYLLVSMLPLVTLISNPARADVIYLNDFENSSDPLSEWSNTSTDVTPGTILHPADRFLGKFDNHTVSLTLDSLPAHTEVTLSFDLYAISSWDGIGDFCCGPDQWFVGVAGGPTLLHTTFSNTGPGNSQSYPGTYPGGVTYPMRTGALESETLGYPLDIACDSVYRLQFTFAHSEASLVLQFGASVVPSYFGPPPYPGWTDECWGLDNVVVEIPGPPSPAEQIQEILDFVEDSVTDGTLVGEGKGSSAENKLQEFISKLEDIQTLIENESFEEAVEELDALYKKCDGNPLPPDFVTGPAVEELAEKIQALQALIVESVIDTSGQEVFHLDTGFDVELDGFPFSNSGDHIPDESPWNFLDFDNNACLGMSAFAQTYYVNFIKHSSNPTHLAQWCDNGTCPYIPTLSQWCPEIAMFVPWLLDCTGWDSDKTAIYGILFNMYLRKNPIVVLLKDDTSPKGHAVLAYRVSVEGDSIVVCVYNPNSPGDKSEKIIYDTNSEEAEYSYFTKFNWIPFITW